MTKLITNNNHLLISGNYIITQVTATPPIAGYSIWLDSSDVNNLVLDNNNVVMWKDSSNNGRDLSAPSDTRRPLYTNDRLGKPAVLFNTSTRSTQMLLATASIIDYATSYTFFIVHDYSGFSSTINSLYQTACFAQGTDSQHNVMFSTAYPGYDAGSANQPLLDTFPPFGGGLRLNNTYTLNTKYITMGKSDTVARTLLSSSGDTATNAAETYTGALTPQFVLGNLVPSGSVHMYMGGIYELIIYNSTFTPEQINTTMTTLAAKWDVTIA